MDPFEPYEIPIKSLEPGVHVYDFLLDQSFFENFEASPIGASALNVKVILDKRESMLLWAFVFKLLPLRESLYFARGRSIYEVLRLPHALYKRVPGADKSKIRPQDMQR